MPVLVLVRHGQSQWNLENRFTGWTDIPLSDTGVKEAHWAGESLRKAGYQFDAAVTSVLTRSVQTLWIVLAELGQEWIQEIKDWRLNERHYGALQGLNKMETAEQLGARAVYAWRRSYTERPPQLEFDDPRHPRFDRRYAGIPPEQLPSGESLEDTQKRVLPCWQDTLAPRLKRGEHVLVSAHGNSLRALLKFLDGISDADIPDLNVPTGIPLVYQFDSNLSVLDRAYLADAEMVEKATEQVRKDLEKLKRAGG
jgi:2,3-bisphosphoglycerate-dependent phosphoglycerate mutase